MGSLRRRLLLAFHLLALAGTVAVVEGAWGQSVVQRIAAVVNDEIISNRELAERVGLAMVVSGIPDSAETRRQLAPQVLRLMIDEKLQLQEARRLRLSVTDDEINRAFDDISRRNNMSAEQLHQTLRSRNVDPAMVREQIRAQIAWLKVIGRELRSRVVVTSDQVEFALRAGPAVEEEVLLSEILLPVYENDDDRSVMAEAVDLAASVRRGADFAALARQISAAPSAEDGGDVGWVRLSSL
jgi:peptidyl-prolyl cis-trans isomerase SurA